MPIVFVHKKPFGLFSSWKYFFGYALCTVPHIVAYLIAPNIIFGLCSILAINIIDLLTILYFRAHLLEIHEFAGFTFLSFGIFSLLLTIFIIVQWILGHDFVLMPLLCVSYIICAVSGNIAEHCEHNIFEDKILE